MALEMIPAPLVILSESFQTDEVMQIEDIRQFMRFECQKTDDEIGPDGIDRHIIAEIFYHFVNDEKIYWCTFGLNDPKMHWGLVFAEDTLEDVIKRLLPGSPISTMKRIPSDYPKKKIKEFGDFGGSIDITEE